MFFQDAPADTSAYMIAGYVVFVLILAIYLVSLFIRTRNLNQDLTTLESLRQERTAAEDKAVPAKRKTAGKKAPRSGQIHRKAAKRT